MILTRFLVFVINKRAVFFLNCVFSFPLSSKSISIFEVVNFCYFFFLFQKMADEAHDTVQNEP